MTALLTNHRNAGKLFALSSKRFVLRHVVSRTVTRILMPTLTDKARSADGTRKIGHSSERIGCMDLVEMLPDSTEREGVQRGSEMVLYILTVRTWAILHIACIDDCHVNLSSAKFAQRFLFDFTVHEAQVAIFTAISKKAFGLRI